MKYKTYNEFEHAANLVTDGMVDFEVSWCTGGEEGGSCWDEYEPQHCPRETEQEPEDTYLDIILEDAFPELSFLQYRRLLKAEIYDRRTHHSNDYYGNWSLYSYRKLNLKNLYNALCAAAA